jgi:hypothetical protein
LISPFFKPWPPHSSCFFSRLRLSVEEIIGTGGGEGLLSNEVRKMGKNGVWESALLDRETNEGREGQGDIM